MYRRKTVETLVRQHVREKDTLLQIIREQNDRLMHLAGAPWALPPRALRAVEPPEDEGPEIVLDPDQLLP